MRSAIRPVLFALLTPIALSATPACSDSSAAPHMGHSNDASTADVIVIDADSGAVIDAASEPPIDASHTDANTGAPDADVVTVIPDSGTPDGGTCAVHMQAHPLLDAPHIGAPLQPSDYNSSPPSSGPHCDQWGQLTTYPESRALPACYFLHNLEHAAIALLYNCPEGCPEVVAALEQVKADAAADPNCAAKRILITPYADMDATIAAAAWGFTWTSDCTELFEPARDSLLEFIAAHMGSNGLSPEPNVCGDGAIGP